MPSRRVPTELNLVTYFLTLTVERWYHLSDRFNRCQLLADSLRYCQEHKALSLNGYVFMLNHLHLIVTSPDVSGFLRDFKRFTSKKIRENIEAHEPQVLKLFVDGENQYRFWMDTNAPKRVENRDFYLPKLNYIHKNPVRKGDVRQPEYGLCSSGSLMVSFHRIPPLSPMKLCYIAGVSDTREVLNHAHSVNS